MTGNDATPLPSRYELKSELARFCLPAASRDSNRKLAWANSICLLFLTIGIVGGKPGQISIKAPPPIEQAIPVIVELPPPPIKIEAQQNPEPQNQEKSEAPQVVVVTPEAPNINFSIPTIGNLVVPNAVAQAPPATPLKELTTARNQVFTIDSTGSGGERPEPQYPKIARDLGQQGTVLLSITVNETGSILAIEVKQSSGFPILDRATLDFVKRHWILPPGVAGRVFEAPIRYVLNP